MLLESLDMQLSKDVIAVIFIDDYGTKVDDGWPGWVIVKQALPYVRLVGDSWPLPLARSFFESQALLTEEECAPGVAPNS